MIIVYGVKVTDKQVSSGVFMCPKEMVDRRYTFTTGKRSAHLWFIPLKQLEDLSCVECQSCKSKYDRAVLDVEIVAEPGSRLSDAVRSSAILVLRAGEVTGERKNRAVQLIAQYLPGYELSHLETDLRAVEGGASLPTPVRVVANPFEKEGVIIRLTLIALGGSKVVSDAHRAAIASVGKTFAMTWPEITSAMTSAVQANSPILV
jgi:hypothetical protein